MRNIQKLVAEPRSLSSHRCKTHSNYDNYAEKDELRQSLVKEQRGLCCYCLQRIQPNAEQMKIEHWQCQEDYSDKQLDYSNLLGACLGGKGKKEKSQHCDTKKGKLDLLYNPANPVHDVEGKLKFLGSGKIESTDLQFNKEVNMVLNLNEDFLMKNRKALLDSFRKGFMSRNPSKTDIQKELRKWNGELDDGMLEPFCQVVIYYLRKKLQRMS